MNPRVGYALPQVSSPGRKWLLKLSVFLIHTEALCRQHTSVWAPYAGVGDMTAPADQAGFLDLRTWPLAQDP